jgi:hypothetical protein
MKKIVFFFLMGGLLQAQTPTFSNDIAPLIYNKCGSCHRPGEIGPMPFTNYNEVSAFGSMINFVVQSGYMPPWMPNPSYRKFVGEKVLSAAEKQLIADWVNAGMPEGDPNQTPPFPTFPQGSALGVPDTVIPMAQALSVPGNNQDLYRVFVLPTGFTTDKDIAAIEFRAGNRSIVHHAIIVSDVNGYGRSLDNQSPGYGYTSFGGFGIPSYEQFLSGWAPGMEPRFFPDGIGFRLKAGTDLLLQVHYAPTAAPETDSSYINIFFAKKPITRYVQTSELLDFNLNLPANQITTHARQFPIPGAISLLSITPHSHLIGKSWELFVRTPQLDTIPIIQIPNWDFNWQGQYFPEQLVPIPLGSFLRATAVYDNTSANPNNPNSPPQRITWGENTTDEMFYIIAQYVPFQPGDDTISLNTISSGPQYDFAQQVSVFPNPFDGFFEVQLPPSISLQGWRVYDSNGKQLEAKGLLREGTLRIQTDHWPTGAYFIELRSEFGPITKKLLKQ